MIEKVLKIADITIRPEVQIRKETDPDLVKEYRGLLSDGVELDPIHVFETEDEEGNDGFLLSDGFHRILAYQAEGRDKIPCTIYPLPANDVQNEAILHSVEQNGKHGKKLTTADKWNAVAMLLAITEYRRWSDKKLASKCGVSGALVAKIRDRVGSGKSATPPKPRAKQAAARTHKQVSEAAPTVTDQASEESPGGSMIDDRVKTITTWFKQEYLDWPTVAEIVEEIYPNRVPALLSKEAGEIYFRKGEGKMTHCSYVKAEVVRERGKIRVVFYLPEA